jgi:hypothetical protein
VNEPYFLYILLVSVENVSLVNENKSISNLPITICSNSSGMEKELSVLRGACTGLFLSELQPEKNVNKISQIAAPAILMFLIQFIFAQRSKVQIRTSI